MCTTSKWDDAKYEQLLPLTDKALYGHVKYDSCLQAITCWTGAKEDYEIFCNEFQLGN